MGISTSSRGLGRGGDGVGGVVIDFAERMRVLARARALDMDPDEYARCCAAWRRYAFVGGTPYLKHAVSDKPVVPVVWQESSDGDEGGTR